MVEWVKQHPYLTGATVVGIFILVLILRRGSGSTAAAGPTNAYGPSDSLQAMAIQAGAGITQAQLGAQLGQAQVNAAVAQTDINAGAAVQQKWLDSQVAIQSILTGGKNNSESTAAALRLGLVQTGAVLALNDKQAMISETPGLMIYGSSQAIQSASVKQADTNSQINTAVTATPGALPGSTNGPNSNVIQMPSPAVPAPNPGQSWDQYYAGVQRANGTGTAGASVGNPGSYFNPGRVALQENTWAAAQNVWTANNHQVQVGGPQCDAVTGICA